MAEKTIRRKADFRQWVSLTLILLGSLWLLQAAWARVGARGVIAQNIKYDAGRVKSGSLIHHAVHLINLSSQPVDVDAVPACGCTVADLPFRPLAPFHSEDVGFEVDTEGMALGQHQKLVTMNLHSGSKAWKVLATVKFDLQ